MPKLNYKTNYQKQTDGYMEAISAAMGAKRMKQRDIAYALNKTPSTVSRNLADIDNMKLGEVRRLASLLGLSVKIEEGEKK